MNYDAYLENLTFTLAVALPTLYPDDLTTRCPRSSRSRVSLANKMDPLLRDSRCWENRDAEAEEDGPSSLPVTEEETLL